MKTKSLLPFRSILIALAVILLTGMMTTAPAEERNHPNRSRETGQQRGDTGLNSVPRPVVDETPINPDSYGNQRKGTPRRDRDTPREQHRQRNPRR